MKICRESKMDAYEKSCSSFSSIGCLSADSSSDSISSNMVEEDCDDDAYFSSPSNGIGPLFELSDLMSQLPIKRGLSRYYNGKSDSFKNLTSIKSLEDVPKLKSKGSSNNKPRKYFTTPKSKISKSRASTRWSGKNSSLTNSCCTRISTRSIHA